MSTTTCCQAWKRPILWLQNRRIIANTTFILLVYIKKGIMVSVIRIKIKEKCRHKRYDINNSSIMKPHYSFICLTILKFEKWKSHFFYWYSVVNLFAQKEFDDISILGFHNRRIIDNIPLMAAFFLHFNSYHRYQNSLFNVKQAI